MMIFSEWIKTQRPSKWNLDQATVDLIKEYFYYREIFDDDKMDRVFSRTIDIVRDRYKQMLRVESIEFDPLVSKYFEAEYTTKGNSIVSGNKFYEDTLKRNLGETQRTTDNTQIDTTNQSSNTYSEENEGAKTERVTDEGHTSKQGSGSTTGYSSTTAQSNLTSTTEDANTTQNNGTSHDDKTLSSIAKAAAKAAPMNASGVGTSETSGKLYGLDFGYASNYNQNDNDSTEVDNGSSTSNSITNGTSTTTDIGHSNNTVNNNGSSSNSESGTADNVRTGSYGDTAHTEGTNLENGSENQKIGEIKVFEKTGVNTDEKNGNVKDNSSSENNELKHERYAGRDNVLPQDAMASATHYLMNYSTAFQWLCNKLEPCFIGVYDV